jgi:hypothetical protein
MPEEGAKFKVVEDVVLKKFDGEVPFDSVTGEAPEGTIPAEEVHVRDGEIIKHIVKEKVVYDKEAGVGEKPDLSLPAHITEEK